MRYFFDDNVPSSSGNNHRGRIENVMEEWEEAANDRIRFKEVNDGLDEFGYPRFKIEQNTGVSTAFVSGGVGANVWHSMIMIVSCIIEVNSVEFQQQEKVVIQ